MRLFLPSDGTRLSESDIVAVEAMGRLEGVLSNEEVRTLVLFSDRLLFSVSSSNEA